MGSEASAASGRKSELSEWQRSKFCEANSEQRISGTATGHNGADSKSLFGQYINKFIHGDVSKWS